MKQLFLTLLLAAATAAAATAQNNVGINTNTPAASAALDVTFPAGSPKGMLVPRVTLTERGQIATPATGLLVYQTDNTPGFYFYNGTAWAVVGGGGASANTGLGTVKDGNNVTLGVAINITTTAVTVRTSTGHYVDLRYDGTISPLPIYFATSGCSAASGYVAQAVANPRPAKFVFAAGNGFLYTNAGSSATAIATPLTMASLLLTNGTCNSSTLSSTFVEQTTTTRADIGLPATAISPVTIQ